MKMKSIIKKSWNLQENSTQKGIREIGIGNQWCCAL
jgi:hypothetical protein